MNKNRQLASLTINLAIFITEAITCTMNICRTVTNFKFYTLDSNIILGIVCLLYSIMLIRQMRNSSIVMPEWIAATKHVATSLVTVTMLVVIFVLTPLASGNTRQIIGYYTNNNLFHHVLCPVAAIVTFLLFDGKHSYTGKNCIIALIPTVIYAVVLIILNILRVVEGPYAFLRVHRQPWWMSCIWFVVIVGAAYVFALLLKIFKNKLNSK